jgi:hypothetical protein
LNIEDDQECDGVDSVVGGEFAGRNLGRGEELERVGAKAVREQLVVWPVITVVEGLGLVASDLEDLKQAGRPSSISCECHAEGQQY